MQLTNPALFITEHCFIGGEWFASPTQNYTSVVNPSTQQPIGGVPNLGSVEAELSVEVAQAAFQGGSKRRQSTSLWY